MPAESRPERRDSHPIQVERRVKRSQDPVFEVAEPRGVGERVNCEAEMLTHPTSQGGFRVSGQATVVIYLQGKWFPQDGGQRQAEGRISDRSAEVVRRNPAPER